MEDLLKTCVPPTVGSDRKDDDESQSKTSVIESVIHENSL